MENLSLLQKRPEFTPKLNLENEENSPWEKEIDAYAENLAEIAVQENILENNLLTPAVLKKRLKEEFKESLLLKETKHSFEQAIEILNQEEVNYPELWSFFVLEFKEAAKLLKEETNNQESHNNTTLMNKANLSNRALDIIEEIAKKKYNDKDLDASKTLFNFLSIINHTRFENWQRLGVTLQELKEYEKAIHAYENAWIISQENIPNRLFVAECYLELKNKIKAEEFCEAVKRLIESQNSIEKWGEHLTALEQSIALLPKA